MKGEMKANQQNLISSYGTQSRNYTGFCKHGTRPEVPTIQKNVMCVVCVTFSFNISPWKK